MQRMRSINVSVTLALGVLFIAGLCWPARADLIRPKTSRSYPDIAGDIVGSQTYIFDPASRTGTFQVVNSPQFITLGPKGDQVMKVNPDPHGTLLQTLRLKLDQNGRLVETAENRFQLYGSVEMNNEVHYGLLLEGKPTAFGAQAQKGATLNSADAFDLNMTVIGGKLAFAFGREAYFRVVPQTESTFQGSFDSDFSGNQPLTNLRSLGSGLPTDIPEPTPLVVLLTGGVMAGGFRLLRRIQTRRGRQATAARGASSASSPVRPG